MHALAGRRVLLLVGGDKRRQRADITAAAYLAAALEEAYQPGGQFALLAAPRQIAEAQGMASVAERAGLLRESVYRALSPRGNPTLKTLLALLHATGLRLAVNT